MHPDPLDPAQLRPDPATWSSRRQRVFASAAMRAYRSALEIGGRTTSRSGILDDLSTYFRLDVDTCVTRCRNWEDWNVQEWQVRSRETPEGLADFYHTTESWAFDLMWYAYLQAEGYSYPVSVAVADSIGPPRTDTTHLDFGSGVGVTSQLFSQLGYVSTLADISTSLLGFARFRLERRGSSGNLIDLNTTVLAPNQYDVITAIDTLVHIPKLEYTMRMLHRALRPGGLLFANFDVRPKSIENAAHLYSDDRPLRWQLQRIGFEPEESLDGMITRYRRVEPTGVVHQARGVRDAVLLRSPLRAGYRALRRKLR